MPDSLSGLGLTALTLLSVKSESLALAKHECMLLLDEEGVASIENLFPGFIFMLLCLAG